MCANDLINCLVQVYNKININIKILRAKMRNKVLNLKSDCELTTIVNGAFQYTPQIVVAIT